MFDISIANKYSNTIDIATLTLWQHRLNMRALDTPVLSPPYSLSYMIINQLINIILPAMALGHGVAGLPIFTSDVIGTWSC